MDRKLTEQDARTALRDHVCDKADDARRRYGGRVDYAAILRMLEDRNVVRYPTEVRFDSTSLEPGEFAHALPLGENPLAGFHLVVHPKFETRPEILPGLIAYHLVRINYGEIATHEEAELFGATLLGLDPEEYYLALCSAADSIPPGADPG